MPGTPPFQVNDDPALLTALLEDVARSGPLWTATPYWQAYCNRIVGELNRVGLRDFRRNPAIVKGFAEPCGVMPSLPRARWKRAIWRTVAAAPVVSKIVAEYERLIEGQSVALTTTAVRLARQVLDAVAAEFPHLAPPPTLAAGNPRDAFDWRGHAVTSDWAVYVARAADFYLAIGRAWPESMIEIGPGIGLSALAHKALNPKLRLVVHVDIVPVIYVSTQYLRAGGATVIGYEATRAQSTIAPEPGADFTILQLAPWQLERLRGRFDYFFNAYSFQEMEREICANYAGHLTGLVSEGGMLHSSVVGDQVGVSGQRAPVGIAYLESLFSGAFPRIERPSGYWTRLYEGSLEQVRLLRK